MNSEPQLDGSLNFVVDEAEAGARLDLFLAGKLPQFSRSQLRRVINATGAKVGGERAKASHKLRAGEVVSFVPGEPPREAPMAEEIPLTILYEDDDLAVVDKPPNMVVHPAQGQWAGTLTGALQFHFNQLSAVGGATRPGIVHRLDRDTSGVILVAKNDAAHLKLAAQFEARSVEKQYFAIVSGRLDRDRDVIEEPIGPHPYQREKMAIRREHRDARDASTFYEVAERFAGFTAVHLRPRTGRTHQIRVHLAHIGAAVLCDKMYGGRSRITRGELLGTDDDELLLDRQALHAVRLKLKHPTTGEPLELESPLPADIQCVLEALRSGASAAS